MTAEFLNEYAWIFWIALILIFVIVEVLTVDFTFLMLALGSVGGLLTDLVGAPWWVQLIVASVLSLLLLFAVRPPLLRALRRGGDPALSNVDALLGLSATVTADFDGGSGHVKLANGETWTARLRDAPAIPLHTGDRVTVVAIEGATAVVSSSELSPPQKGSHHE
jgi:membrane protein implicated in regulation of membrane protease activity